MDIVNTITSYAKAVPAGLKAAGQELAKTAAAVRGAETSMPARARPKRKKKTGSRGTSPGKATRAKAMRAKPTRRAKRSAAKPKRRKTSR
jgi:hypothetical protein